MVDKELLDLYASMKKKGIPPEIERSVLKELDFPGDHKLPEDISLEGLTSEGIDPFLVKTNGIYSLNDFNYLQDMRHPKPTHLQALQTMDDLLDRDKQRKKDGFPKKIKIGRIVKPTKGGKGKVIVVPTTREEKFLHDNDLILSGEGSPTGGSGEGEEGDVIGEGPIQGEGEGDDSGAGQGEGEGHGIESGAYDLGKILTEEFQLPNLKDKGKKRAFTKFIYDLTDRYKGHGQFLDKKRTLINILKTNLGLGRIPDKSKIDPTKLIVSPNDKTYRLLSREKLYESQALVFFLRDYSGSMWGKPTEVVVTQHVMLYAWLTYQYKNLVESRFILHDTHAKEVPDFYTYYNTTVAGGTNVYTAFELVNKIVEEESLARDYNIYVFYGGDGDDWSNDGKETLEELRKILTYSNRTGITIANDWRTGTTVESYLKNSNILEKNYNLIRLDSFRASDATEERLIQGIKKLIQ